MAARKRIAFQRNGGSVLPAYQAMSVGQFLQSSDGRFKLILQPDGNLVMLDNGAQVWAADASQSYSKILPLANKKKPSFYIQYSAFLEDPIKKRLWISVNNTFLDKDQWNRTHMVLQNDGNLVLFDFRRLWNSNNKLLPDPMFVDSVVFPAGFELEVDKKYISGTSSLVFQADGNLVVSGPNGSAIWTSNTPGKGAVRSTMLANGNFVIYNANNAILWQSGTAGHPGAFGRLQENGSFSVILETAVWARFGFAPKIRPIKVFYPDHTW